jgi:hypothetical protein
MKKAKEQCSIKRLELEELMRVKFKGVGKDWVEKLPQK